MSKLNKETVLSDLTTRIFSSMLGEVAMDAAIQAQKEVRRSMDVCKICGMQCNQVHNASATAPVVGTSRAGSPSLEGASQPGTGTPSGSSKTDGNINLECVNCQRPVASNRYAQHLATCLGIGTGVRRAAQRNAVTKTKTNANTRSGSPYVDDIEDVKLIKGKSKAKGRALGADEDLASQKQAGPPTKKQKKGKATAMGTGPPRLPANRLGPPSSSSKPSSRLRSTPTPSIASHLSKASHSPASAIHSSSPDSSEAEGDSLSGLGIGGMGGLSGMGGILEEGDADAEGTESQSQHSSTISPSLPNAESIGRGRSKTGSFSLGSTTGVGVGGIGGSGNKPKKVTGTGPPKKPLPPPHTLPTLAPPPPPVRRPESNFLIDIEGEETGSDTD